MRKCITNLHLCIGRDAREINGQCCHDEIRQEISIVQNIVDSIDDCSKDLNSLQRVSSKLSYGASVINKNGEEELIEVFPIVKRFSHLMHEFQEKILNDTDTNFLVCSFTQELKKWFSYAFLEEVNPVELQMQRQSIISDIHTIEMTLGICMISESSEYLDDIFF